MPKNLEELNALTKKQFKTIYQSRSARLPFSRIDETILVLECPFCSTQFDAISREGCFGGTTTPSTCPNCDFPHNVIDAYVEVIRKKKTKPRV